MSKFTTKMVAKAQSRFAARRAMGTLEYVLIAAIVVALAIILRGQLTGIVEGLLGNVESESNNNFGG